jgi:hypothetical protein
VIERYQRRKDDIIRETITYRGKRREKEKRKKVVEGDACNSRPPIRKCVSAHIRKERGKDFSQKERNVTTKRNITTKRRKHITNYERKKT